MKEQDTVSTKEAANILGVSPYTLRQLRSNGSRDGHMSCPPFYKLGRRVVYRESELLKWLEAHRRTENKTGGQS